MRPILIASDQTYRLANLDVKIAATTLAQVHLFSDKLCTIDEPSTFRTAIDNFMNTFLAVLNLLEANQKLIKNETRMQCTIEKQVSCLQALRAPMLACRTPRTTARRRGYGQRDLATMELSVVFAIFGSDLTRRDQDTYSAAANRPRT